MSPTVLVVEPDPRIATDLCRHLESCGLTVTRTSGGVAALAALAGEALPDLVVLALELPDTIGLDVCRRIRADVRTRALPLVMVSERSDEIDRVVGLEVGGDDYVTKPYSVRELGLRIRALLRRGAAARGGRGLDEGLRLDREERRAWIEGREVALTSLQFKLLAALWAERGRVMTRDELVKVVWGGARPETSRAIDTHVQRLRDRLGEAAVVIETVRGVGYRLRPRGDDHA